MSMLNICDEKIEENQYAARFIVKTLYCVQHDTETNSQYRLVSNIYIFQSNGRIKCIFSSFIDDDAPVADNR